MHETTKDKAWKGIFVLVVLIILGSMIYFGFQKNGYHVDEVYSYGLANSEYLPFMHFGESGYDVKDWMNEYGAGESLGQLFTNLIKDYKILKEYNFDFYSTPIYQAYRIAQENSADTYTTTWVSGEDYLHYVAVSPQNTFNYASVYYNQRGDVHPPLFYMLLHTICSVFQGSFSKWYGLALNMIFMLLTLWMLYRLCDRFLGGRMVALAVILMYGLSAGFMTTAMFIRMYSVLTFFVVTSCYLHLKLAEKDFQLSRKERFILGLVTVLGFMTHYYYVIYAIGLAVVLVIWMLAKKRIREAVKYILTMVVSAVIGICIWPFAIKHVFLGYRGQGSIQSLINGGAYWLKTKLMLQQIFNATLGGKWWILLLAILFVGIVSICAKEKKISLGKVCMLVFPISFYIFAVAQIVPYYTDRYVMCAFPFVFILLAGSIYHGVSLAPEGSCKPLKAIVAKLPEKKGGLVSTILMGVLVLIVFLMNNCYTNMPGYMYPSGQELAEVPENTDCIYVLPDGDWNESAEESTVMAQCRRVGVVYESNFSVLQQDYEYQSGDCLMVYIQNGMDVESVLERVHEAFGTGHLQEVSRENSSGAVRILLSDR